MPAFEVLLGNTETFRAIRRGDVGRGDAGVLTEIRFVRSLFDDGGKAT